MHLSRRRNTNSQNIPTRDESYADIRRLFVAPPGYIVVKADYNQLELRVLTESSGDRELIRAYKEGVDTHQGSADLAASVMRKYRSPAWDIWQQWKPKDQRYFGKNKVNFPQVYGVDAPKMVEMANKAGLPLTLQEAREILKLFGAKYPRLEEHRMEYHSYILAHHEARTLHGRRRIFPGFVAYDKRELLAALREGFNHRIQGTAADLFKLALLALARGGVLDYEHRMVNYVHDEVLFYVHSSTRDDWFREVKRLMETVTEYSPFSSWPMREWSVPLVVEIAAGSNWVDVEEVTGVG